MLGTRRQGSVFGLLLAGYWLSSVSLVSAAGDGGEVAKSEKDRRKALVELKRQCKDARANAARTLMRCASCRGRTKNCWNCGAVGYVVKTTASKRDVADLLKSGFPELRADLHQSEYYYSAQIALRRFIELGRLYGQLRREFPDEEKEIKQCEELLARCANAMIEAGGRYESLARFIATSKDAVGGRRVLIATKISQVMDVQGQPWVRLEYAEHAWLVRQPTGVRWVQGATVNVFGTILDDSEYTTVLGANRGIILVEPELGSQ